MVERIEGVKRQEIEPCIAAIVRRTLLAALGPWLLHACGPSNAAGDAAPLQGADTRSIADTIATHSATSGPIEVAPAFDKPRRALPVMLRQIWQTTSDDPAPAFINPFDVHFSTDGLLVYDVGDRRLRLVNPATGSVVDVFGAEGSGPGEFQGVVTLFGTAARPMTIEFSTGRITDLSERTALRVLPRSSGALGRSACAWGPGHVMLRVSGRDPYEVFVQMLDSSARLVDSLALPWPHLVAKPFLERQSALQQLDDSTCALAPAYQREFALFAPGKAPILGAHFETLPTPRAIETTIPGGSRSRLAPGARAGHLDVRGWRDAVVVLFGGTSRHARRVLDVFSREKLQYRGSVTLPFEATRIAIRGDTLAAIGEVDLHPVVAVFVLAPRPRGP